MSLSEPDFVTVSQDDQRAVDSEPATVDDGWWPLFEDRYGVGSHDRLMALFGQPCVTFADIASRFGVSRGARPPVARATAARRAARPSTPAAVPDLPAEAPPARGSAVSDVLSPRSTALSPGRIQLLHARDGFRTRAVRLDDRAVAITRARRSPRDDGAAAYHLHRYRGPADFIYYHLADADYLFLPKSVLPVQGALFFDVPASAYQPFKNTFEAFTTTRSLTGTDGRG